MSIVVSCVSLWPIYVPLYHLDSPLSQPLQFHKILAWNKTFFLHCYQLPAKSSQQTTLQFWSIGTQASGNSKLCLTMFWKIAVSWPGLSLTLTSTISPSIVAIYIDSCGVFTIWFPWPYCLKDPWTQLPSRNWHNWKLPVNRKTKIHLNSVTALYCNSNQVPYSWKVWQGKFGELTLFKHLAKESLAN